MTDNKRQTSRGFTLVELMLAMSFIAFLLLFLVAAILQITRLYVKGSAIHQINQTGRQLMDDIAASVRTGGEPDVSALSKNRLCVGNVSYIWNVNGAELVDNAYSDSSEQIRFISLQDATADVCHLPDKKVSKAAAVDLLGPEVTPLKFTITQEGRLIDIQLVLSTSGDNMAKNDPSTPTTFACPSNNQFCAFGDFETSVYSRRED